MWGGHPSSSLPQSQNDTLQFQSHFNGQILVTWPRLRAYFIELRLFVYLGRE